MYDEGTQIPMICGLSFDSDVRDPNPDATHHRGARFKVGWKRAVNGTDYGEQALRELTWENLGWRLGKLLGPASKKTMNDMYDLCVRQQAGL